MKMNKIIVLFIFSILIFILLSNFIPSKVYAYEIAKIKVAKGVVNPNDFEPPALNENDTEIVTSKASIIISIIKTIGTIVSVIALMIIGICYMVGSVEEKADYKKTMIPYLIGVFIFFALVQLLGIIIEFAEKLNI